MFIIISPNNKSGKLGTSIIIYKFKTQNFELNKNYKILWECYVTNIKKLIIYSIQNHKPEISYYYMISDDDFSINDKIIDKIITEKNKLLCKMKQVL